MADQKSSKGKGGGPKHPKPHKGIRQDGRPNGKRWKGGKTPEERAASRARMAELRQLLQESK